MLLRTDKAASLSLAARLAVCSVLVAAVVGLAVCGGGSPSNDNPLPSTPTSTTSTEPLRITTPTGALPDSVQDSAYGPVALAASGGTGPCAWGVSAGSLPPGVTLDAATGLISGTPTAAGSNTFVARVQDASGSTATSWFTILVHSKFVIVRDGGFSLRGQPWFPYGFNYWPRYGVNPPPASGSTKPDPNHWMGSAYYDPVAVETELADLQTRGVNCISTQASLAADTWPALDDFLDRCRAHDLRVFLAFTCLNPFKPEFDNIDPEGALDAVIPAVGLAGHEAIFAYDMAWEPFIGQWDPTRWRYDGVWSRFIAREFGGVAAAQAAFGRAIDTSRTGRTSGIVSHTLPVRAVAGQNYACAVTMRNLGDITWTAAAFYRLGRVIGDEVPGRVDVPANIAPGQDATFPVTYSAPAAPGRRRVSLAMLQENVTWFGPILEWEVEVVAAGSAVQIVHTLPTPVLGPTDAELDSNGPDFLVNAFRRCMDTETSVRFDRVARRIRAADSNHLLSCRQGYGGNGSAAHVKYYPLELHATAPVLDFLGPENYEFMFTTVSDTILGGEATIEGYARWAGAGKPVMWAEAAYVPMVNPTPAHLQNQADYYDLFLDHMITTRADGVLFWWWPGGTRLDENSDFGATNADGTPRPAADTFRDHAATATVARPPVGATAAQAIDGMLSPRGFADIYAQQRPLALAAAGAGNRYVVVGDGDGTTSDQPPAMRGGLPRHLWATIQRVELNAGSGWFEVRDGMAYAVPPAVEILVRAEIVNLGDTRWMPQGSVATGAAAFAGNENFGLGFRSWLVAPVARMERVDTGAVRISAGLAADADVQFQMVAEGVSWIPGSVRIRLVVAP